MAPEGIARWGFGMAPISARMRERYDAAVQTTIEVLEGTVELSEVKLDDLSEAKGMFNRSMRRDQWDWYSVHEELGFPDIETMRRAVGELLPLRRAIAAGDVEEANRRIISLVNGQVLVPLYTYQDGAVDPGISGTAGWIYVLSRREERDVLKIGMTSRSVARRVKEINSATGVLHPYSARKVYRVRDARAAERSIHKKLASFRLRPDREFFQLDFFEAAKAIEEYLKSEKLLARNSGRIVRYFEDKKYGFIQPSVGIDDLFFHLSCFSEKVNQAKLVGAECEFEYGRTPRGSCALDVSIVSGYS